jgi:SAM-dependent methyltransferase
MTDDGHARRQTSFDAPDAGSADANESIAVSRFDEAYAVGRPPWDIDGPQPDFERLVESGAISGRVLDVSCGTGEHALFFASHGLDVVGIDASAIAIERAADKARSRGLAARFIELDVQELADLNETFDTITDSGCLHTLGDAAMQQAIDAAHAVLRSGGIYWLLCFNEHATGPGPRRITQANIAALFADGWEVESIEATHFELVAGHQFGRAPGSRASSGSDRCVSRSARAPLNRVPGSTPPGAARSRRAA